MFYTKFTELNDKLINLTTIFCLLKSNKRIMIHKVTDKPKRCCNKFITVKLEKVFQKVYDICKFDVSYFYFLNKFLL